MYTRIVGTGSYFPEKILTNQDLEAMVDTSDEWIRTRTGISERRIAAKDEGVTDMGYNAALKAFEMAGIKPQDIDGIIFATTSADFAFPSTAARVQSKLGISGSFAFDMNCACSGFLYALAVADGFVRSGQSKTLLVIAAEKLSPLVDWTDRNTCVLFGDGAAAALLTVSDKPGIHNVQLMADGSLGDHLYIRGLGSHYMAHRDEMDLEKNLIHMQGSETFRIAVRAMTDISLKTIEKSGMILSDIDCFVPHQANARIIEAVAKRLGLDMGKVLVNLDSYGNTSAASVPAALDEGIRSGRLKPGDNIALTSFGGGMAWGGAVITL